MASVAIAVSEQTTENGALILLRGSHRCGRIEHTVSGDQTGADINRVAELKNQLERVTFQAEPGDAVFFHSNTLHSSSPNESSRSREVLLCCFSKATNEPLLDPSHTGSAPLDVTDDAVLTEMGPVLSGDERVFLTPPQNTDAEDTPATTA